MSSFSSSSAAEVSLSRRKRDGSVSPHCPSLLFTVAVASNSIHDIDDIEVTGFATEAADCKAVSNSLSIQFSCHAGAIGSLAG